MSASAHPILVELSNQLPPSAHTCRHIQEAAEFEIIAAQAQKDISSLENLVASKDDGQSAKTILKESGYQEWLEVSDQDEQLRVLGALRLIADLSEDLADE